MIIKTWQALAAGGAILVLSAVAGRAENQSGAPDAFAGGDAGFCESCDGGAIGGPVDTSQPEVEPPEPGSNVPDSGFVTDGDPSGWAPETVSPPDPDAVGTGGPGEGFIPDGLPGEWAPETVSPPGVETGGPDAGFVPDGQAGEWATGVLQPEAPKSGAAMYQSRSESGGANCVKAKLTAGSCS